MITNTSTFMIILFGVQMSAALPLQTRTFGEKNAVLLCVITLIGIGALLGMCAFCKKRNGKFKKFENDGNLKEVKCAEYPVLKTINSLHVKQPVAIVPSSPTNLSTDNLLEKHVSCNAGSLSSQELECAENFNLLQYQSVTANKNDSNIVSANKNGIENGSLKSQTTTGPLQISDNDYDILKYKFNASQEEESSPQSFGNPNNYFHDDGNDNHFSINVDKENESEDCNANIEIVITDNDKISCDGDSDSTESHHDSISNESNSIEEALRALDFAIKDELYNTDEDDSISYANVYSLNLLDTDCNENITIPYDDNKQSYSEFEDKIKETANKLVDDVISNSLNIVSNMLQENNEEANNHDATILIENAIEYNFIKKSSEDLCLYNFSSTTQLQSSTPLKVRNYLKEDLFDPAIETENYLWNFLPENIGNTEDQIVVYSSTIAKPSSENVLKTFIENTHSTINEDIQHTNINSDTFVFETGSIQDQNEIATDCFPTIQIDRDKLSIENQTITPVNTPIELKYQAEEWDKWITISCDSNNDQYYNTNYEEEWFLHQPNIGGDASNEMCNNELQDNLNSTFEQLRQQLKEILPHAQGIMEPANYAEEFEKEDVSNLVHYGIQYGDLDEATNATYVLSKDNEMVINYKRTLSPIMEESEEESFCKNSTYNEPKFVESTSTGCMESLIVMGVAKTLMASNDTLFNFEDTLEEVASPRTTQHEAERRIRTKNEETFMTDLHVSDISFTSENTFSVSPEKLKVDYSIEQDSTMTMDDKTFISVMSRHDDDERISEISEPNLVTHSSLYECLVYESLKEDQKEDSCNVTKNDHEDSRELNLDKLDLSENSTNRTYDDSSIIKHQNSVFLQNNLNNLENYGHDLDKPVVIDCIDGFLLNSRNIQSVMDDKSTSILVPNGHLNSGNKITQRSDMTNVCVNYRN